MEKISAMSNKDANQIEDMNPLENVNSIFTIPVLNLLFVVHLFLFY